MSLIATRGPATSAGMTLVDGDHWAEFSSWAGPLVRKFPNASLHKIKFPWFFYIEIREQMLCAFRLRNKSINQVRLVFLPREHKSCARTCGHWPLAVLHGS